MQKDKKVLPFPRQSKLAGILRQYDISYEELAKNALNKSIGAVEAIVNGRVDYKVSNARKIKNYISKKEKKEIQLADIIE